MPGGSVYRVVDYELPDGVRFVRWPRAPRKWHLAPVDDGVRRKGQRPDPYCGVYCPYGDRLTGADVDEILRPDPDLSAKIMVCRTCVVECYRICEKAAQAEQDKPVNWVEMQQALLNNYLNQIMHGIFGVHRMLGTEALIYDLQISPWLAAKFTELGTMIMMERGGEAMTLARAAQLDAQKGGNHG